MKVRFGFIVPLFALALVLSSATSSWAVLANAWHIPDSSGDINGGIHMRDPEFEIANTTTITIYSGVQKFNNSFGTANQTGGTLYYKGQSQNVWQSVALNFAQDGGPSSNNQYWKATLTPSVAGIGVDEVIQYYLYLTFNSGAENTYIYAPAGTGDHGGNVTNSQSTAATSPFTIRNRAAFLFHADNRVISGTSVQFWIKSGYLSKDGSLNYLTNGAVYYTTNGSDPSGSLGVAGANTTVVPLNLDHEENDSSAAGNAAWWVGTANNLPTFTTIKYKIGLWNSSNNEEKFGDYHAPSDTYTGHIFSFSIGTAGAPTLTVNGLNADYTTTHIFVNELNGDSIPLNLVFTPNDPNVDPATVQIFTNLNRRDRATQDANGDGIEDGIMPPDGNNIAAGDDNNYYKAYAMTPGGQTGQYTLTLNAQKTGAYRLTGRYKVNGNPNWIWYSTDPRRDHAIVVSPTKSREIVLYELNTINVESQGTQDTQRSTFVDLWDGPGSRPYNAVSARFNLNYLQNLGINWLWFQPIHPQGIDGRQIDPDTGQPYEVGSPYAVKNFFEVMPLMSKANTRAAAMTEFIDFVAAADNAGINVMLDAPFNHTAYDCELAASGVTYFNNAAAPTDEIRNEEARFYSRTDAYDMRASSASNVAVAPDRYDFGKFSDTHDVYFGRYAALVPNSSQSGNYLNEGDWFDYSIGSENAAGSGNGHFDTVTQNVWKYFSDYILYWLDKTGCPAGTPASQSYKGIDGLRADFGQGLPPQCWEYIINKARSRKWDFVFMTESLDGGAVTYRSNRHFDILNENIVFAFKSASTTTDFRNIFEGRRTAYGQGLVLLNSVSHDEESYDDPFVAFIRYAVGGSVDGAPMIFYGQELGISRTFGFDRYELNFGKMIPHFKKYNSLQPIFAPVNRTYALDQLYPIYAAVGQARQFSPALRSSNRYFLDQTGGGGPQPSIFSVAKYETANGSPATHDVVFAFANLDRNNDQTGNFNVNITQNGSNLFGIKNGRTYDVRNIAAYTGVDPNRRNNFLNRQTGTNLLNNGLFVGLKKVPTSDAGWQTVPFEAQYLKLYDVTAPSTTPGSASPPNAYFYSIGNTATISWTAAPPDSEGVVPCYKVSVTVNGNTTSFITCGTSTTVNGTAGQTITVVIQAVNPNDNTVTGPSSTPVNIKFIDPNGDDDGDGMTNAAEDTAATNPFDANSVFKITNVTRTSVSWSSVSGKKYQLGVASTPNGSYSPVGSVITANSATTSEPVTVSPPAFYEVQIVP